MGVAHEVDEAAAGLHLNFPIRRQKSLKVTESRAAGVPATEIFPYPRTTKITTEDVASTNMMPCPNPLRTHAEYSVAAKSKVGTRLVMTRRAPTAEVAHQVLLGLAQGVMRHCIPYFRGRLGAFSCNLERDPEPCLEVP